jgi:hypothetical protein
MVNDSREVSNPQASDHYRAEPSPAFVDSGSYGADAQVEPTAFGPEIVRDGEITGLGEMRQPQGRISGRGSFGSGWSDGEMVRATHNRHDNERIRGL